MSNVLAFTSPRRDVAMLAPGRSDGHLVLGSDAVSSAGNARSGP
jgi:hypothetical protein